MSGCVTQDDWQPDINYEDLLREYHHLIGEIFLAKGQTPYRICKQLWALHAEFERRLTLIAADAPPLGVVQGKSIEAAERG